MSDVFEIEINAPTASNSDFTSTKNKRTNSVWKLFQINKAKKIFYCNYCKGNNRHAFDYSSLEIDFLANFKAKMAFLPYFSKIF